MITYGSTNDIVETIEVGPDPQGIAIDDTSDRIFVVTYGNEVAVIDGFTYEVIERIKVGVFPERAAFNANNGLLYVSNTGSNSISVIDTKSIHRTEQTATIKVGGKNYRLFYNMTSGGSIDGISTEKYLSMTMNITSPSDGVLELVFPRELYDSLSFTEHGGSLVAIDGKLASDIEPVTEISCEQTSIKIPIRSGAKVVEILYADILMNHTHAYPQKIDLFTTIEQEGQQYSIRLFTDAKKCDVIFSKEEKKIQIDILGRDDSPKTDTGTLRVTFAHYLLGGNYTVLVDGEPIPFEEVQFFTKNYTDIVVESAIQDDFTPIVASHILIAYPKEATRIEIMGTSALPEFGSSVAAVIGVLSISGTILAHRAWIYMKSKR